MDAGRWKQEATFLRLLAQAKARTNPARLKVCFTNALINRWSAQVTHAATTTHFSPCFTSDVLAEGPAPPSRQGSPRSNLAWTWPCLPAHPEPPVHTWHRPGRCPIQQVKPDHISVERSEATKNVSMQNAHWSYSEPIKNYSVRGTKPLATVRDTQSAKVRSVPTGTQEVAPKVFARETEKCMATLNIRQHHTTT